MKALSNLSRAAVLAGLFLSAVKCSSEGLVSSYDLRPGWAPGSGSDTETPPGASPFDPQLLDPSCQSDAQCLKGEICQSGVCQMQRCGGTYTVHVPLRQRQRLFNDQEFVVADASSSGANAWLDAYAYSAQAVTYIESKTFSTARTLDLDAGHMLPGRKEQIVTSNEGSTLLRVLDGNQATNFDVGFVPIALATGDVNQDGLDEVVGVSAGGSVAVCHADTKVCSRFTLSVPGAVLDLTMGDLDRDGFAEVIFLQNYDGGRFLDIWHATPTTQQEPIYRVTLTGLFNRIAAGDLDDDGKDDLIGLADSEFQSQPDRLVRLRLSATEITSTDELSVNADSVDIAIGNVDALNGEEIVVIGEGASAINAYKGAEGGGLKFAFSAGVGLTVKPRRIALVDYDGDTPVGELVGEPTLVPTNMIPAALLQLPPYSREMSDGTSSVSAGTSTGINESYGESVTLSLGTSIGFGGSFLPIATSGMSRALGGALSKSSETSSSIGISGGFGFAAEPKRFGNSQAAVILTAGCYLNFIYQLDDPAGVVGTTGSRISIMVPVDGQAVLWDLRRYNKMAQKLGNLPIINPHSFESGSLSTYPKVPLRADGSPIPAGDNVFPQPTNFLVSDVGPANWSISLGTGGGNSVAASTSLSFDSNAGGLGFSYGSSVGQNTGSSISLGFSNGTNFGGSIPPIYDNLATPEDEYNLFRYTFKPFVYRQWYNDAGGNPAAYYVITYAIGN